MQCKISNIKYKLHSIPILSSSLSLQDDNNSMKNKSNVLYSIPCSCVLALLLVGVSCLVNIVLGSNGSCYAADTTSASLSLSNSNMTSSAITPGNTTTVSTNVSVKVDNAESYSLILKVDNTTLKNGNTTITAGNVVNDNTWGYKWDKDNTSTYKAPTTTGTNLTVPTLTNNSANFEGILTFGAKFSTSAEAGHYRGSGTLSLVAEPKAATSFIYTLSFNINNTFESADEAYFNNTYKTQSSGETSATQYTFTIPANDRCGYWHKTDGNQYGLDGWATTPTGTIAYPSTGGTITATSNNPNIILYAKWSQLDIWCPEEM